VFCWAKRGGDKGESLNISKIQPAALARDPDLRARFAAAAWSTIQPLPRLAELDEAGRIRAAWAGYSCPAYPLPGQSKNRDDNTVAAHWCTRWVPLRWSFQLPTVSAPTMAPSAMSVSRESPRHMTVLPGGASLARAR
jgi:hypothetical protein